MKQRLFTGKDFYQSRRIFFRVRFATWLMPLKNTRIQERLKLLPVRQLMVFCRY